MILVADAGSTKTSWAGIPAEGAPFYFDTTGINPYFHSRDEITHKLLIEFPDQFPYASVSQLFFFGAGCSSAERIQLVQESLAGRFAQARIHVAHDLLGAAIALCGHEPGIACILGTGSNSCRFDGGQIVEQVAAPGFILGDEGSGAYMGKRLALDLLRHDIPSELEGLLREQYRLDDAAVLRKVYTEKDPNRFLASLVTFVGAHIQHPYCKHLVRQAFADFYTSNIRRYADHHVLPVHFTGSVAFHFRDILFTVLEEHDCIPGKVVQRPIELLALFYRQYPQGLV